MYENRDRNAAMLAALFRRTLLGFETITAAGVRTMYMQIPGLLEMAIIRASGLKTDDDAEQEDEATSEKFEDSMFLAHQEEYDPLDDFTEEDRIFSLHEHGYTFETIATLQIPEIEKLTEGAERADQRQKRGDVAGEDTAKADQDTSKVGTDRSRTDQAAKMGWR